VLIPTEEINRLSKQIEPVIGNRPKCKACGLKDKCISPKMKPTGEGRKKVLVVAEAPGAKEDERGTQLIGKSGQHLRNCLRELDWSLDKDCWKTNAVICRPPDNKMQDRYVKYCRPNLLQTVDELEPETIILLGARSVQSFIGHEWGKEIGGIGRWAGWKIPLQSRNAWVCSTYHPSYLLRENNAEAKVRELWFKKHLQDSLDFSGRPWSSVPTYKDEIQIVLSEDEAASYIRRQASRECPVSFDYETNMLKPDSPKARIVSCAICWGGKDTIAYPWVGKAVKATQEVLRSSIPKYGANIKFEQRWTKKEFGHGVRNWKWDTMQATHILDNRPGISSVKFQAFVRLGLPPWDHHIESFLEDKEGNTENRIDELDMSELLEYNGMDALVEYKLAKIQMKEMGT
jgi:DNA polymerase